MIARRQLLALGLNSDAIQHRRERGRLHPIHPYPGAPAWRGVYAVGSPDLTRYGIWMAAVLVCGPNAGLSDTSAGALWKVCAEGNHEIHVSVTSGAARGQVGIVVHRRSRLEPEHFTQHHGIPVTSPTRTLVDLATQLGLEELEAAVNEASSRNVIDVETLRGAIDEIGPIPGLRRFASCSIGEPSASPTPTWNVASCAS